MSFKKRSVSNWMNSSFDFDLLEETAPKKSCLPASSNSDIVSSAWGNFRPSDKKKINNSLSVLLAYCEPQKLSDLAISRQKQQEISKWLTEKVLKGKPSIAVICGPSGCGKTSSLRVIAKEKGFEVVEWITPMDQHIDEHNRAMRQGERFEDFLLRATRYNSVLSNYSRRLLIVKDIPNAYLENKEDFGGLLHKYCQYGKEPLAFICSETGNSKVMRTLFPDNVRYQFKIDVININAATQKSLQCVMKRVSSVLNSKASHMLNATSEKIQEVLTNTIGDVRSGILNLIFCSLKVQRNGLQSECTVREETLGLLHGIGRVIYPKKEKEGTKWKFVHNPDELASCFQSQANTFISFIHENCLATIGTSIENAAASIDVTSLADVLNSEWRDNSIHELALSYCIRGVMIANAAPVTKWNPVHKPPVIAQNVQRNLSVTEVKFYENFIKSKQKQPDIENLLSESLIEEIMEF